MRTHLIKAIQTISSDRHKLVILMGNFGAGKTALLKDIEAEINGRYVNLNLLLSERLLACPRRQYDDGVTVHRLIDELCDELSPDKQPLLKTTLRSCFHPK